MPHIVIVDDEEDILSPLKQMLTSESHQVDAFSSGRQALDYFQTKTADLAIFDIKMPQMDGYELLKSVRQLHPNIPVIFLSSKADEQDQIIG